MNRFINRYVTPLTTGLFAVTAISGVALFFHWAPSVFHEMHEWLSMLLLAPIALHVSKNWNGLVGYARRHTLIAAVVASLMVAMPFAAFGSRDGRGRNPGFKVMSLMTQARISDLAPVLKTNPGALVEDLRRRGYKVASTGETLDAVAAASGAPAPELLFAVMPAR